MWRHRDVDGSLSDLVCRYIDRVVNAGDTTAIDEMVAPDYRGTGAGWPATIDGLRRFYAAQAHERPDWHIDVEETVELGDSVVARARASGTEVVDDVSHTRSVEWLTHYRIVDARITEINVLVTVPRAPE